MTRIGTSVAAFVSLSADRLDGLEAVHLGHLDVHQDEVEALALERLDGRLTVADDHVLDVHALEQPLGVDLVRLVVLGDQHARRAQGGLDDLARGLLRRVRSELRVGGEERRDAVVQLRGLHGLRELAVALQPRARQVRGRAERREQRERRELVAACSLGAAQEGVELAALERDVEQHEVVRAPGMARALQPVPRLVGPGGRVQPRAPTAQRREDRQRARAAVVDDQAAHAVGQREGGRLHRLAAHRDLEPEDRAVTFAARDLDRPAEVLDDLLRDREPEPRPAVPAGVGCVDLRERLEEPAHAVLGDADAGVLHGELDDGEVAPLADDVDVQRDLALLGELDRVADQIGQDLPDAAGIADHAAAELHRHVHRQFDLVLLGARGEQLEHISDEVIQLEGVRLDLQLAGLDLGEVEDVVDDSQEAVAGALDRARELVLLLGELGLQEEAGHPEDAVQRRPGSRGSSPRGSATSRPRRPRPGRARRRARGCVPGPRSSCG